MGVVRIGALALLASLSGCTCGGEPSTSGGAEVGAASGVDAALLATSWPIVYSDDATRAPFEQPGWFALVSERDHQRAVAGLGPGGGLAAARAHAEAAAMYRQAARLSAIAAEETFGGSARDTDPVAVAHLVMLGHVVRGDLDAARGVSAPDLGDAAPWNAPWKVWLDAGAAWPPDLAGLPVTLPAPAPGTWPEIETAPHYRLPERVEGDPTFLDVTDPSVLIALAVWHDAAARLAAPDADAALDTFGAWYRLGPEPAVAGVELPPELVFGSDFLVPGDGPYLAALTGDAGIAAIDAHRATSVHASVVAASRGPDGKIDPQLVLEQVGAARSAVMEAMVAKAGGNTLGLHRVFGDVTQVALLRAAAVAVEVEGNHEGAGILLINAMERSSTEPTADPAALLFLCAWDADNRYPVRGTEILHNLIRRYPSLDAARFGLEALSLRESRARGPQNPGL